MFKFILVLLVCSGCTGYPYTDDDTRIEAIEKAIGFHEKQYGKLPPLCVVEAYTREVYLRPDMSDMLCSKVTWSARNREGTDLSIGALSTNYIELRYGCLDDTTHKQLYYTQEYLVKVMMHEFAHVLQDCIGEDGGNFSEPYSEQDLLDMHQPEAYWKNLNGGPQLGVYVSFTNVPPTVLGIDDYEVEVVPEKIVEKPLVTGEKIETPKFEIGSFSFKF
jgi:hypothetical protein